MSLCALDKRSGRFLTPKLATKLDDNGVENTSICVDPACNSDLKLRQPTERVDHFVNISAGECSKYSRTIRQKSEEHSKWFMKMGSIFQ